MRVRAIPTYRVYRLYDIYVYILYFRLGYQFPWISRVTQEQLTQEFGSRITFQ